MANKLFNTDSDTKAMLQEISSAFGVKQDVVKHVWEFTVFSMLLRVAEKDEGLVRLTIPYIGSIGLKCDDIEMKDNKAVPELQAFLSLSDNFKDLYQKVRNGFYGELSDYLQDNYIDKVIDNIN